MNFDVDARTILYVRSGSHAYGLATPTSDEDFKGVCIPPLPYHLGYLHHFEQQERLANKEGGNLHNMRKIMGSDVDSVVYSLKKFVKLAADCNPNIIEVLFGADENIVKIDDFGRLLLDHRDWFLSRKARWTFAGYAHAQLKRIERHRRWLLNPPSVPPTRKDMGLPERTLVPADQLAAASSAVEKKLEEWKFNEITCWDLATRVQVQRIMEEMIAEMGVTSDSQWIAAARAVGYEANFIELMFKERSYKSKKNEWDQYKSWEASRNPARAEQERKFGYDTKHASHLLRLMRMCKEILSGQGVIVKRPDAEELIAIKVHGAMKYDDLLAEAKRLEDECSALYETSPLPNVSERVKLDELVISMTQSYLTLYR